MNTTEIINMIDNLGALLFEIEINGRQSIKMAAVIKGLDAIRKALAQEIDTKGVDENVNAG